MLGGMASTSTAARDVLPAIDRMFDRATQEDDFSLLGVERDAPPELIKSRYIALAKRWHVDAFAGVELGARRDKVEIVFKRIGEAYSTLSNPESRAEYEIRLDREQAGLSTDVAAVLRAETLLDEGLGCIGRRQWRPAVDALREARELNPDDPIIWTHLAWAEYRAASGTKIAAQRAIHTLERAGGAQEVLPEAWRYLGTIAFEAEEPAKAIKYLQRALEQAPRDVEATRLLRLIRSRQEKQKQKSGLAGLWQKLTGS